MVLPFAFTLTFSILVWVCAFATAIAFSEVSMKTRYKVIWSFLLSLCLSATIGLVYTGSVDPNEQNIIYVEPAEVIHVENTNSHIMVTPSGEPWQRTFEKHFNRSYNGQTVHYVEFRETWFIWSGMKRIDFILVEDSENDK